MTRIVIGPVFSSAPVYACTRRAYWSHIVDYFGCDCLRTELPASARALSSGRLGSAERNHTCPACNGDGWMRVYEYLASCPRCAGCGERKADREPADHAFPESSDTSVCRRLTAARAAGLIGRAK